MGKWTALGATALLAGAAGCAEAPEFREAKAAVAQEFAYPSSVEFRGVKFEMISSPEKPWVCGEARGKDLSGQMTGYRRFSWSRSGVVIEGQTTDIDQAKTVDVLVRCV
jgi:hypothetical protein